MLLKQCVDINPAFLSVDLLNLEDFAVRGRYPHDFIIPAAGETQQFYEIALSVKAFVLKSVSRKIT